MRKFLNVAAVAALASVALADDTAQDTIYSPVPDPVTTEEVYIPAAPGGPDAPILYTNSGNPADPYMITPQYPQCAAGPTSNLQVNLQLNVYGFGAQGGTVNNSVADDFVVPTGETWNVEEIVLYMYQTGATAPTINGVKWGIGNVNPNGNVPNMPNSSVPAVSLSGAQKDTDTLSGGCARRFQKLVVTVSPAIQLTAGQYWLEWQATGTLASGPWQAPVVEGGQQNHITGDPGLQSIAGGAYTPVIDSGLCACNQDFIFVIGGTKQGGSCKWDLNGDGKVCQEDLGILLAGYGTTYNQGDLGELLAQYNGGCGNPC